MSDTSIIQKYKEEINSQLADADTMKSLLDTAFKGLTAPVMKRALLDGLVRGFSFKDFLEKNVYAIPFRDGYSLITGIDHARKIGMRNGIVGRSAPEFREDDEGNMLSCTITIKRKIGEYIGEFTETVYLQEYTTGKNLWVSKPRTMLAKVAEMHALRAACPEDLAQYYSEEEMQAEMTILPDVDVVDLTEWGTKLEATTTKDELAAVWVNVPGPAKPQLQSLKDSLKLKYEDA